ncbi:LytR/AlgR family response regulator transcription factor [Aliikangiella coralliicola]|nr:LytTR family DNA-binding domain-containing protein [Aliikangiella coralliicola]
MSDKFKVIIVDDEQPAREKLALFLQGEDDFQLVGEACNGIEALDLVDRLDVDLIFLDIQMPQLDGMAVASNLETHPDIRIIFITGFNEFAIKAFELNAVDYLLKPYDKLRLQKTLERVREQKLSTPSYSLPRLVEDYRREQVYPEQLLFKTESGIQVAKVADIEWIESSGNYIKVCLSNNAYIARQTLTCVQSQLAPDRFVRTHRSFVVNLSHIARVRPLSKGDQIIFLNSGVELKLSRNYKEQFFQLFANSDSR